MNEVDEIERASDGLNFAMHIAKGPATSWNIWRRSWFISEWKSNEAQCK